MTEEAKDKAPEAAQPAPAGQFGQFLSEYGINSKRLPDSCGVETIELESKDLDAALKRLRKAPETALNYLVFVGGMDSADSYDSIYQLWSYENNNELLIKVKTAKSGLQEGALPAVPSATPHWPAANWHERETYDLVGIHYTGHPYMRRILNPWDWEGHPLRHDYKQPVDALNDRNPHSFR